MSHRISASILSANFSNLGQEIDDLASAGVDSIHLDVMDNHYVPNLTFGPMMCKALCEHNPNIPFYVHVMAKPIEKMLNELCSLPLAGIIIHPQQTDNLANNMEAIKEANIKVGIALNPHDRINDKLLTTITNSNEVLVMGVQPGFGAQSLIPETLSTISKIRTFITFNRLDIKLAIDGGVNLTTIKSAKAAGADTFVIGSALLNSNNYQESIATFKELLSA